eukprot:6175175-Pleurochrysis_carterae.AAC.1
MKLRYWEAPNDALRPRARTHAPKCARTQRRASASTPGKCFARVRRRTDDLTSCLAQNRLAAPCTL